MYVSSPRYVWVMTAEYEDGRRVKFANIFLEAVLEEIRFFASQGARRFTIELVKWGDD